MSSDVENGTVEEVTDSASFENDPELLAAIEQLDAIPNEETSPTEEEKKDETSDAPDKENEPGKQEEVKKEGKIGLSDLKGKTWEELSLIKDSLPDEFKETFKSMERAVQIKMQAVAEEKKKTKGLQEEIEQIKRQLQEEPPYLKAERERQRQREEAERLEAMDPEERRTHELESRNQAQLDKIKQLETELKYSQFKQMKAEWLGDIRDELLSNNLPVKDKNVVYDLWVQRAKDDENFTISDAVNLYKEEATKPKAMTQAEIDAQVEKRLNEKLAELKAKAKGATGIKSSSSSSGKNLSDPKKEARKINTAEDIFADLSDLLPDD